MLQNSRTRISTLIITAALALSGCGNDTDPASGEAVNQAGTDWMDGVDLAAFLDCTRESGATLLQAHRAGDRPGYAENALSTMTASIADGAVFLEIDVAKLSDGTLVLMHDDTVDRTTTGQGSVFSYTLEDFKALRLVDLNGTVLEESPPTLAEALIHLDGRGIAQLDLKDISVAEIADALVTAGATERAVVITYTLDDAIALHRLLPDVIISAGINSLENIEALRDAGFDLTRLQAWLGVGDGNPDLDQALAEMGIETSFGNFRAEADGSARYLAMNDAGAEVISVDDVQAASRALNAAQQVRGVLASCPAAQG